MSHSKPMFFKRNKSGTEHLPSRRLAAYAISKAIKAGELPRAKTLSCVDCDSPAEMYDHYKGYAKKFRLTVQPVCRKCDGKRRSENGQVGKLKPFITWFVTKGKQTHESSSF